MTELVFNRESLETLLKIARAEKSALEIDLIDIEHARTAAQNAFANIDSNNDVEGERRKCLQRSIMALRKAEDSARDRYRLVADEIAKLDHMFTTIAVSPCNANVRQWRRGEIASQEQLTG